MWLAADSSAPLVMHWGRQSILGLVVAASKPHRMMLTLAKARGEFIFKNHPPSAAMPLLQFCTGVSGSGVVGLAPAHPETHHWLPIAVAVPMMVPVTVAVPITSPPHIRRVWAVGGDRPGTPKGQLCLNLGQGSPLVRMADEERGKPPPHGPCLPLAPLTGGFPQSLHGHGFGPCTPLDPLRPPRTPSQRHGWGFVSSQLLTDPCTYRCGLTPG